MSSASICFGEPCPEAGNSGYRVGLREYQQALQDGSSYVRMLKRTGVKQIRCVGRGLGALVAHQVANTHRLPAVLIDPKLTPYSDSDPRDMLSKLQLFLSYDAIRAAEEACVAPNAPRLIYYDRQKAMPWFKWLERERGICAVAH